MSKLCLPPGVVEAKDHEDSPSLPPGIELAFCPTGEDGGVDPACPSGIEIIEAAVPQDGEFEGTGLEVVDEDE